MLTKIMFLVLVSLLAGTVASGVIENTTDPNKDMYVIHAMMYQVGIISNKTDEELANSNVTGHQEAITFFKSNGTGIDLGNITSPIMTNVTAQSLVGVAPAGETAQAGQTLLLPWKALENLTTGSEPNRKEDGQIRKTRYASANDARFKSFVSLFKRSLNESTKFFDTTEKVPIKIEQGVATVPYEAGVNSIAIPPLISFNNNFSDIPVPIPNTSIVHYAKVNTLVHMP